MALSDIPIFSMLRTRMQWHQERQRVLADNQMDFQTVSALYSKGLGLIKLAVGKK